MKQRHTKAGTGLASPGRVEFWRHVTCSAHRGEDFGVAAAGLRGVGHLPIAMTRATASPRARFLACCSDTKHDTSNTDCR